MINSYQRFLPAIAITLVPLYPFLKRKTKDLKWGPLQEAAFCNTKKALSTDAALTFPITQVPLVLSTNANDVTIGWIATFGVPEHTTSDMGTTLTSQLWTSLENLLGITLHQTTALSPTANEMVELFHRTLKAPWFTQLPWVLLGLRTTPKDTLDISAA
ncbi:uncharacterized protein [Palaemon carinicauda]|uniref:uncharacterized protein n=1 Tax=Palaemon carinicauda TaxID=392227 RepID=UPI0035B668C1